MNDLVFFLFFCVFFVFCFLLECATGWLGSGPGGLWRSSSALQGASSALVVGVVTWAGPFEDCTPVVWSEKGAGAALWHGPIWAGRDTHMQRQLTVTMACCRYKSEYGASSMTNMLLKSKWNKTRNIMCGVMQDWQCCDHLCDKRTWWKILFGMDNNLQGNKP